jgi:hypothetical protein
MKVKRQKGIFEIEFDTEKADFEAKLNYNKIGFLADILVEVNEKLLETNQYRQEIKLHGKGLSKACESIITSHYRSFEDFGNIEDMHSLNIYQITAKAYDEAFKFFTERKPNEICSIMELIRKSEEKGLDLKDIAIEYVPIKV